MASSAQILQMANILPSGFVDLDTAAGRVYQTANVIGVVCDHMPPSRSRGSDIQMSFTIIDQSSSRLNSRVPHGLSVKFFRKNADEMPPVRNVGDVVLLRNVKITTYSERLLAMASFSTTWILFHSDAIPASGFRLNYATKENVLPNVGIPGFYRKRGYEQEHEPSIHEQQWVITLHDAFSHLNMRKKTDENVLPHAEDKPTATHLASKYHRLDVTRASNNNVTMDRPSKPHTGTQPEWNHLRSVPVAPRYDKFGLIKDLAVGKFYDLATQVVKKFNSGYNNMLELYVTDYTSNRSLYDYTESDHGGNSDWHGPFGQMTLRVELMPPHNYWALENVHEGDLVFLKNVRIKMSNRQTLEANMWSDNLRRDRINISLLEESAQQAIDLVERRKGYKATMQKKLDGQSKRAKRNNKKASQKDERKMRVKSADDIAEKPLNSTNDIVFSRQFELNENILVVLADKHKCKPVPLEQIINFDRSHTTLKGNTYTLPFVNFRAYTNVRVIDYYPHQIKDFAIPVPVTNSSSQPDSYGPISSDLGASIWQWSFWLLLEEAVADSGNIDRCKDRDNKGCAVTTTGSPRSHLPVIVSGRDAEFLLDLDAVDLNNAPKTLSSLRERLFLLWGDLEEQKSRFLASAAFEPTRATMPKSSATSTRDLPFDLRDAGLELQPTGRPFTACVAEYGVWHGPRDRDGDRVGFSAGTHHDGNDNDADDDDGDDDSNDSNDSLGNSEGEVGKGWVRCHRMCQTNIRF